MEHRLGLRPIRCAIVAAFVVAGCASVPPPDPAAPSLQILEFRGGLLHQCGWDCWQIEAEGEEFDYRVNGRCMVGGSGWQNCMWHGWMIRFEASEGTTTLDCAVTYSQAVNTVNSRKPTGSGVRRTEFKLTLKGRSGTFWHPNYIAGDKAPAELRTVSRETICNHQGKEVVRYRMTTHEHPER